MTPAQVKKARDAIAVYTAYYALIDRAFADPAKDWSADIAKLAADPEKSNLIGALEATAKLGQYRSGHIVLDPQVTRVRTGAVDLTICVDSSHVGFFNKAGQSIKVANGPGSYYRHVSKAQVYQFVGNQWLVTLINSDNDKPC